MKEINIKPPKENLEIKNKGIENKITNEFSKLNSALQNGKSFENFSRDIYKDINVKQLRFPNQDISEHPITQVPFKEYEILNPETGEKEIRKFPEFDTPFETKLPEEKINATDSEQFQDCTEQLSKQCQENPEWAKENFSEEQLEDIKNGYTPEGYTWHHHQEPGKMQLVDTDIHSKTAHTGGKAIWGGGKELR